MNEALDRLPEAPTGEAGRDQALSAEAPEVARGAPADAPAKPGKAAKAAKAEGGNAPTKAKRGPPTPRRSKSHEREFVPINKHPVFEVELPLKSDPATRVFENTFEPAQNSFFHLQVILPRTSALDTTVLETTMEYVDNKFTEIESEMQAAMDRLIVLKNDCGARTARQYVHAENLTVQVMTPMFERFLSLIIRMDEIMQLVDSLWFARRLNDRQRAEVINQWRNRLVRFNREIFLLKQRASGYAEKVRSAERARGNAKAEKAAAKEKNRKIREAAEELADAKVVRGSAVVDLEKGVATA